MTMFVPVTPEFHIKTYIFPTHNYTIILTSSI